jgi:hypothetical protein
VLAGLALLVLGQTDQIVFLVQSQQAAVVMLVGTTHQTAQAVVLVVLAVVVIQLNHQQADQEQSVKGKAAELVYHQRSQIKRAAAAAELMLAELVLHRHKAEMVATVQLRQSQDHQLLMLVAVAAARQNKARVEIHHLQTRDQVEQAAEALDLKLHLAHVVTVQLEAQT